MPGPAGADVPRLIPAAASAAMAVDASWAVKGPMISCKLIFCMILCLMVDYFTYA
jgi:hypothetical protein